MKHLLKKYWPEAFVFCVCIFAQWVVPTYPIYISFWLYVYGYVVGRDRMRRQREQATADVIDDFKDTADTFDELVDLHARGATLKELDDTLDRLDFQHKPEDFSPEVYKELEEAHTARRVRQARRKLTVIDGGKSDDR